MCRLARGASKYRTTKCLVGRWLGNSSLVERQKADIGVAVAFGLPSNKCMNTDDFLESLPNRERLSLISGSFFPYAAFCMAGKLLPCNS